jgi:hypothetical protein
MGQSVGWREEAIRVVEAQLWMWHLASRATPREIQRKAEQIVDVLPAPDAERHDA